MTIEQQLKDLRLSMGLIKSEFAKKTGINASSITKYERGETKASKPTVDKINKALGTSFKAERVCADCGMTFEPPSKNYKYCSDCVGKQVYKYPKKVEQAVKEKPVVVSALTEFNGMARERKMTYGQLQAEMYKRGGANIGII